MEYFKNLPEEITLYVLTRLPTDSILICKLVCRTWRNLIAHHPLFRKMHLHNLNNPPSSTDADSGKVLSFIGLIQKNQLRYFEMDDENNLDQSTTRPIERIRRVNLKLPNRSIFILGCCNGLICIGQFSPSGTKPYICNPITKEFLMLPETNTDYCDSKYVYIIWGFGYVYSVDQYKVVGIHVLEKAGFVQVHVYTLSSGNGWRNLGEFNLESSKEWGQGVFVNGYLYWVDEQSGKIVTFDLAEEKFCKHLSPPPPLQSDHSFCFDRLGVLDGLLYLAVWVLVEGVQCFELWLLKRRKNDAHDMKEQKEHKSWVWSKEFRVDESKLFAVTKMGDVLTYSGDSLYIFDPKASTSKMLVDFKELIRRVLPHKNTFLSLKELGEEDTKIMESIEVAEVTESIDHPLKQLAIGG